MTLPAPPEPAPEPLPSPDPNLRQTGERVQQLLGQLTLQADRRTALAAEELVSCLTQLYGAGLEHMLEITDAVAPNPDEVLEAFASDELVSSLMVLHGIHPVDVETRIARALDKVRPYLGSHGGDVEVLGIDDEGVLRLRLKGSCDGCGSSAATLKYLVEGAVLDAAPEIERIEVEGLEQKPRFESDDLIPLASVSREATSTPAPLLTRRGELPERGWVQIGEIELAPGETMLAALDGRSVLVCRAAEQIYAYQGQCAACGLGLESPRLDGTRLICRNCGAAFDLRLAGRRIDAERAGLQPIPLLQDESGVRLALGAIGAES